MWVLTTSKNSFHHNIVMCWKLVCWSKYVCNTMILRCYMVQKQVTETQLTLSWDTSTRFWFLTLKDSGASAVILCFFCRECKFSLDLFQGFKPHLTVFFSEGSWLADRLWDVVDSSVKTIFCVIEFTFLHTLWASPCCRNLDHWEVQQLVSFHGALHGDIKSCKCQIR